GELRTACRRPTRARGLHDVWHAHHHRDVCVLPTARTDPGDVAVGRIGSGAMSDASRTGAGAAPDQPARPILPGTDAALSAGELVVLTDRRGRRYLVDLEPGGEWHSHAGLLPHDELIGRPEGTTVRTNRNM